MRVLFMCLVVCLVVAVSTSWAADDAIRFAHADKEAGTLLKPLKEHPDPAVAKAEPSKVPVVQGYTVYPFDVIFLDVNGDGKLDLFQLEHHACHLSHLWLGDGKGKMIAVEQKKVVPQGKVFGNFSLLPYDFGSGAQDLFTTVQSCQTHYTGPVGKLAPEEFQWTGSDVRTDRTILLADFDGDGLVDAAIGGGNGYAGGYLCRGEGKTLLVEFKKGPDLNVGFHSVAADLNGDGWPDVLAGSLRPRTENGKRVEECSLVLHLNDGKGSFRDASAEAGLEGAPSFGGLVVADFNNDGLMDIYSLGYPSIWKNEGFVKLYLNAGGGRFTDATAGSGLEDVSDSFQHRYSKVTCGDFNNDGLVDIVSFAGDGKGVRLYRNLGNGKFQDVTTGLGARIGAAGKYCAASADYDDDGRLDLAFCGSTGPNLCRNVTESANGWLKVRLHGPKGNPEAAGASVTIYQPGRLGDPKAVLGHQQAVFSTDFHVLGSWMHFGLGSAKTCDLVAVYPGGRKVEKRGLAAGSREEIRF